jgi:SPASM domain peptide maturase of grasp-with-spasm system
MMVYRLNNDCIPVKGARRSAIYDLKHLTHYFIPNTLLELLSQNSVFSTKEWVNYCGINNADVIDSYILYLKRNSLINSLPKKIILKDLSLYKRVDLSFCNAIVRSKTCFLPIEILEKLVEANIKYLQLVVIKECIISDLQALLSSVNSFISVELFIRTHISEDLLIKLVDDFVNVKAIFLFNSATERVIQNAHPEMGNLYFINEDIENLSCGYVCKEYFCVNTEMLAVSKTFNSCLFGKISIDENDLISNCLFSGEKYGKYRESDFKNLIKNKGFTKHWNITKDQIDVCKDCEFRHMCTDCRIFIKDPENIYSQPAKCTYNPYIAKWQGEDGYVPVEKCGTYTRETGFVVNHERVAELNKQLWGE